MDAHNYIFEDYKCECGNVVSVLRTKGKRRDKKHLKSMFCPFCNKEVNHNRLETFIGKNWTKKH